MIQNGSELLEESSLGALGCQSRSKVEKNPWKSELDDTTPRGPFWGVFGTFCSLGRPWDLQIVVWGRIRFDIGFRIEFWLELEAFGIRHAPRIDTKTARCSRADWKSIILFRLCRRERIEGRTLLEKHKNKNCSTVRQTTFRKGCICKHFRYRSGRPLGAWNAP